MGSFTSIVLPDGGDIHHLYLDESGELGFHPRSCKYFLITVLSTTRPKALLKRMKKQKAQLYNAGWPKAVEIKGTSLWGASHIPGIPDGIADKRIDYLNSMISSIAAGQVKVHYSIVKKERLSEHLRNAPYGITYNFLAGKLITRAYQHYNGPISLMVDQRSKETHNKTKFDGYIETRLIGDCEHADPLEITHNESHDEFGLQAVDFMSWGLYRWFEHRDRQFADLIAPSVGYIDDWYPGKWCPGK